MNRKELLKGAIYLADGVYVNLSYYIPILFTERESEIHWLSLEFHALYELFRVLMKRNCDSGYHKYIFDSFDADSSTHYAECIGCKKEISICLK